VVRDRLAALPDRPAHRARDLAARLDRQIAPETLLSRFDVGDLPTEALLFQTGYLTIDRAERIGPRWLYHLRYPNLEVRIALNELLLDTLTASRR
jgi:hypothetical protein